jgi:hypothetical protein
VTPAEIPDDRLLTWIPLLKTTADTAQTPTDIEISETNATSQIEQMTGTQVDTRSYQYCFFLFSIFCH